MRREKDRTAHMDSNVMNVRMYRIKKFLKNLVPHLSKERYAYQTIIREAMKTARGLFSLREEERIVEVGLVAFWLTLQERGIQAFRLRNLVEIAKETLERQTQGGRILQLLSKVRIKDKGSGTVERVRSILSKVFLRLLRGDLKQKAAEQLDDPSRYIFSMEKELQDALETLEDKKIAVMGLSPKVLSALVFYVVDRVVCKGFDIAPVFSCSEATEVLGVSKFTILRKYKTIADLLGKDIQQYYR